MYSPGAEAAGSAQGRGFGKALALALGWLSWGRCFPCRKQLVHSTDSEKLLSCCLACRSKVGFILRVWSLFEISLKPDNSTSPPCAPVSTLQIQLIRPSCLRCRCWREVFNLGTKQAGARAAETQPKTAEDHLQLHHRWVAVPALVCGYSH